MLTVRPPRHALHYLLSRRMELAQGTLVARRALILVGQEHKSAPSEKQLPALLNRSEAQRQYTERHELTYPTKNERKGIIKRLIEEGLGAKVTKDDFKVQVNREIGELVDATAGNWMRLEQRIRALDDCMKPQPDNSPRHITPAVLRGVRLKQ